MTDVDQIFLLLGGWIRLNSKGFRMACGPSRAPAAFSRELRTSGRKDGVGERERGREEVRKRRKEKKNNRRLWKNKIKYGLFG